MMWILLTLSAPALAAGLAPLVPRWRPWLVVTAAVPAVIAAVLAPTGAGLYLDVVLLGGRFVLDPAAHGWLLLSAFVWLAASGAAWTLCRDHAGFAALFALSMAGNLGAVLAADVLSLYAAFAVMTLAAYGLVVHERSRAAMRAGWVYVAMSLVGELALLSGLVLAVGAADGALGVAEVRDALPAAEHGELIIGLLLVGFGVKAGVVPLHLWLPLAHPAAPVPASAVLSGAMIKVGLVGWLRLLPLAEVPDSVWGGVLIVAGIATAYLGVLFGVAQTGVKTVLAYSSVSQMGLMATLVGVGLLSDSGATMVAVAVGAYAVHHGLAKGALFLGVGVLRSAPPDRVRRVVLVGMGVAAAALAGVPLTSGWIAKLGAKRVVELLPTSAATVTVLLSVAAAGTTVLLTRGLWLAAGLQPGDPGSAEPGGRGGGEVGRQLVSWAGLTLASVAAAPLLTPWLRREVGVEVVAAGTPGYLWNGTWPVVVGLGLVAVVTLARRRGGATRWPTVPPGDLVVLLEATAGPLRWVGRRLGGIGDALAQLTQRLRRAGYLAMAPNRGVDRIEEVLTRWRSAGVAFVAVTAALLITLGLASR